MTTPLVREHWTIGLAAGAAAVAAGAGLYFALRKRESPEEIERKRREFLMLHGRIIDGEIVDVADTTQRVGKGQPQALQLLLYKYEIAGVSYECSQDVTQLNHHVDFYDFTVGLPASVRYDPHNPGNSIVVSDSWSGLRLEGAPLLRLMKPTTF